MIATNKGRKTLLYLFPIVALLMAVGMSANGVAASSEFRVARAGDSQLTTHNSQLTTRNSSRPTTNIYCVKADGSATGAPCTNPNAIANIQTAIAGAAAGDEIRVAYGPFTGSGTTVINATVPLTIIGGFPGGTTGWTNSTDAINTVIDGQGIRLGVSVSGVNLVLQNLTVSNGGISNSGGTVSVQSGYTLNIQSGPTISGAFNIANGGVVAFTSGINTLASGTTFTGAGVARVTNGTLSVNGAVTAQNFDLVVGGTLTGSGTFTVNGVMNWTGGVMDSPSSPVGVTTIANGAVLNLGGISAAKVLLQRTLNNNGTTYMNGSGSGVLDLGNSTTFNNNGIFIIQNNDSLYYYTGATPHFNNAGTFRKSAGSGVSTFTNGFIELSNSGLIRTESGTLSLDGASGVNAPGDTGTFSATVGSTLRFGGNNHVMAPASTVDIAGTIEFSAGTTYINGSFNVSGNTLMSGGTVVFGAPAIIDTLNVTPNSTFSLTGSGSVLTVNHLNWTGGIIDGGPNPNNRGTINVPAGGTITLGGVPSNKILLRCTINNNGSALVNTTGLGTFYMGDAAVFNNNNLFNLANNDSIRYLNGVQSTFNNAAGATFRKSQGPLVSTLGDGFLQFNNSGAVEVQVGTLSLDYSATTPPSVDTGSYSVSNGATLRFNGVTSSRTLQAGSSITGAGTVEFSAGTVSIAGNYNVSGNTNVTGGTVQFNTPATTNAALLSAPGTLSGDSTFTTNAIFNWTGGTMSGQGTTIISPSSTLHIAGVNATKVLTQRTINNLGTVHVDGTGVGITYIGNGGVFNNGTTPNSDVNFFIENNDSIRYLSGTNCTFNNNGHLKKSLGAGISTLSDANLAFNNYGDVQVLTGTLSLDGGNSNGLNSTGPFTVTAQANLRFNGGAHTLVARSSTVGAGSVELSAGTVNIGGNYNIGGTTSVTGGTVQFNANATSANTLVSAP